jgi:hypothetical protein
LVFGLESSANNEEERITHFALAESRKLTADGLSLARRVPSAIQLVSGANDQ